jgi:hypothetical protein
LNLNLASITSISPNTSMPSPVHIAKMILSTLSSKI